MLFNCSGPHIAAFYIKFQPMLPRQPRHKLPIRLRLRSTEPVIKMNYRHHNPKLAAPFDQQPQQRHRINPARNSHAHAIARLQQFLPPDVFQHALG